MDDWNQAHVFVGQAIANMSQQPPQREQDLQRAGRALGRAYQLFLRAGLTKEQAVDRIIALAQMFGSLE